ncbi:MAG: hypothetical protein QM705_10430 [Ancrocorticia sp.]
MNDQYPASPTPGQPDRRGSQRSAWRVEKSSSGSFGRSGGQGPSSPFSTPESNSGPFSSGGTTSLFHSGRKQAKSAWGTPVPDAQGPGSNYAGQGGYGGQAAPRNPGAGGGAGVGMGAGTGYRNLSKPRPMTGGRFAFTLIGVIVTVVISFGAGLVSFFTDDDPEPAPIPSFSMPPLPTFNAPVPVPSVDGTSTPNPNNGQNEDGSVTVGAWRVEKVEFLPDATERLKGVAELPELDKGFRFAGVKMRFTNEGDVARSPAYEVGITAYYGPGGGDRSWEEMSIHDADSVRGLGDVEPGASIEGWYYVQLPEDYTGGKLAFFDYEGSANVESDMELP